MSKENEVNEEKFEEENQIQFRNSYLRIPGPGTRASQGCLEIPCRKQKFGEKSSSDLPSSSGAIRNFTGVHGSSEEGELSGPKYDSSLVISKQLLGSDACSCSTAATNCGTVLAGNNILNCTLGGKTTGGRNKQYNKDNELSLYGQLGQKSGPNQTSQGIINTKHQQIKSPAAGSTDTSA